MAVGSYNWDSYSHTELYALIDGEFDTGTMCGKIPAGGNSSTATGTWTDFHTLMTGADTRIRAALTKAGAHCQGAASDAAAGGITPLAQWNDQAHQVAVATTGQMQAQSEAYYKVKNDMPAPVA